MGDRPMEISASLMCADFARLPAQLEEMRTAGITRLHLDFADGHFVPNLLLGTEVLQLVQGHQFLVESHLMIERPELFLNRFHRGSDLIVFHLEAARDPRSCPGAIHSAGRRAGIALKPSTRVADLTPLLCDVDLVLIMTVEPGFAGGRFLPETIAKVSELRRAIYSLGTSIDVEVDGGINSQTIPYRNHRESLRFALQRHLDR
jgi:ribulose-phosphate 3-epimerase